jgi:trimeric autotransporter adhesin
MAGGSLTTGSNNIDIGNQGVEGESNTIRIGTTGEQTATYVAGIWGGNPSGGLSAVYVNSLGQLSAVASSRRFKKEIKAMEQTSEAILALKPVTFRYKSDGAGTPQFGLIAEEVAKVCPDLVLRDKNGEIYTVRYEAVNAMLLNEFLKEHHKVQEQQTTINELQSTVAQQQEGMKAFATTLRDQASQIQKVSAQFQASRPEPQTVLNNR